MENVVRAKFLIIDKTEKLACEYVYIFAFKVFQIFQFYNVA